MSLLPYPLPERAPKPRQQGITLVLDKGLSTRQVEDLLEIAATHCDLVKLGWGTSIVSENLKQKIQIYQSAGIPVFLGGTLFEAYAIRGQFDTYLRLLNDLNLSHIEISDGTITIPLETKLAFIRKASQHFTVLSEVGSKDPTVSLSAKDWVHHICLEQEAGAWKVICEARESGSVGLFDSDGGIQANLLSEILEHVSAQKLIFEAPLKSQQTWFIQSFGANVNLGNIATTDVIALETLRLGLRSDTFFDLCTLPKTVSRSLETQTSH